MVTHTCSKCNKSFNQACNYKRHLARKTDCSKPTVTPIKPEVQKPILGNRLYLTVDNLTIAQVAILLGNNLITISKEPLQKSQYVEPIAEPVLVEPIVTELIEEVIEVSSIHYEDIDNIAEETEQKKTKILDMSITEPVKENSEFEKRIELEAKRDDMITEMKTECTNEIKKVYKKCHLEQRRTEQINSLKRKLNKNINSLKRRSTLPPEAPSVIETTASISADEITNIDAVVEYAEKLKDTVVNNRVKAFDIATKTSEETVETRSLLQEGESSFKKLNTVRKALKDKGVTVSLPKPEVSKVNLIDDTPEMEYVELQPQKKILTQHQVKLVEEYFEDNPVPSASGMSLKDKIINYLPPYDSIFKHIINVARDMD